MHFDPNVLFVAGVSIGANVDNCGVALAYGMLRRSIRIGENAFIAAVSALFAICASAAASAIAGFVSRELAGAISGSILIAIGLWAIADLIRDVHFARQNRQSISREEKPDRKLTLRETVVLSVALAINAGASGLAAGFAGRPQVATSLGIGACSIAAILIGQWIGKRMFVPASPMVTQAIGAAVLVTIGIFQFP